MTESVLVCVWDGAWSAAQVRLEAGKIIIIIDYHFCVCVFGTQEKYTVLSYGQLYNILLNHCELW